MMWRDVSNTGAPRLPVGGTKNGEFGWRLNLSVKGACDSEG